MSGDDLYFYIGQLLAKKNTTIAGIEGLDSYITSLLLCCYRYAQTICLTSSHAKFNFACIYVYDLEKRRSKGCS